MNYEEQISDLEQKISYATEQKNKAEARLESLQIQEKDLLNQLNEIGLKPEDLEGEIQRLENEIKKNLEAANQYLPKEIWQCLVPLSFLKILKKESNPA